ncbi:gene transfer agent family protein [Henriciella aquimarina]|uniref:gene transfer agent family protein n=1 Tax=Henriciella aquimarina TaxID=545261 RepID=UPI0009FDE84D|nr:gene transfer agent family protein [Henriciella aquimarina]
MSTKYRSCEVTLEFADADYLFRLPLKRIAELEERCSAPIGTLWKRVCLTGDYKGNDLIETVRLGLIGGGMDAQEARKLIERYCDQWPLAEWHSHALAILGACVEGYEVAETTPEADSPKKQKAAGTDTSTSPPATRSASKKASARKPSKTSRSGSGKA